MKTLAPPHAAPDDGNRRGQLVFHLKENAADGGNARGEALDNFRGGSDGVAGDEIGAGGQRAFAGGLIAVQEMRAGQNRFGGGSELK